MHLDLSEEETFALLNLLTDKIENDRYPLSPRVQTLRDILAKFGPMAPRRFDTIGACCGRACCS